MPTRLLRLAFAALLLAGMVMSPPRQVSAQAGQTYFITNVDDSQFPNVTFQVRVVDLNNDVVGSLGQNLPVYENGEPASDVRVTPSETGPLNIIFAVDLGRNNRFNSVGVQNARLALTTLVTNNYFRDELDQLEVMGRQNTTSDQTIVLWPATSQGQDLINFANGFTFPRSSANTKGLLVVEDAITEMLDLAPIPGAEAAAIVFLSRYIEDPSGTTANAAAAGLGQTAREHFIDVYSIQFDTSGTLEQPFINLTSAANGTNSPVSGNVGPAADQVFKNINTQRTVYTVSYRSSLGQEGGERTITINSPESTPGSLAGRYNPTINKALVTISQPANGSTIRRTGQAFDTNGEALFDADSVTVGVDIAWPEGVAPRNLASAELRVNGVAEANATPAPDATRIDFTWDLRGFVNAGQETASLEVTLIDELGVESVSGPSTVSVDVTLPATAVPTAAVTATSEGTDTLRQYGPAAVVAVICMGMLAVALVGAVLLMRPRGQAAPARPQRGGGGGRPLPAGGGGPDHTIIVGAPSHQNALATLTVLEGPRGMIGETISLTKPVTVMGRNPELADVVFYPDEPSSLSRVHCTIQLDGKYFVVTDSNSTNGTRVNGELLKPSDPVQLRDGDELVLGDLGKLGVKMRFSTSGAQDHTELKDRTYIVDDYEQQDWDKFKES